MIITPDYDSFARAYERGEPQIVSTRLVSSPTSKPPFPQS